MADSLAGILPEAVDAQALQIAPFEPSFAFSCLKNLIHGVTPVPMLVVTDSKRSLLGMGTIQLSGGVDLSGATQNTSGRKLSAPDPRERLICQVAAQPSFSDLQPTEFYYSGKNLSVAAMPFTTGTAAAPRSLLSLVRGLSSADTLKAAGDARAALRQYDDIIKDYDAGGWAT